MVCQIFQPPGNFDRRSPEKHEMNELIRRNFRADKFSRIFEQNLNLREIARK